MVEEFDGEYETLGDAEKFALEAPAPLPTRVRKSACDRVRARESRAGKPGGVCGAALYGGEARAAGR